MFRASSARRARGARADVTWARIASETDRSTYRRYGREDGKWWTGRAERVKPPIPSHPHMELHHFGFVLLRYPGNPGILQLLCDGVSLEELKSLAGFFSWFAAGWDVGKCLKRQNVSANKGQTNELNYLYIYIMLGEYTRTHKNGQKTSRVVCVSLLCPHIMGTNCSM